MASTAPTAPVDVDEVSTLGQRWYVLIIMMLAYTINIADRYVMSTVLEPIRLELNLTDSGVAFLTGVSLALFYVTMGIPLSWIADRYNRKNLLAASMAIWSAMTARSSRSSARRSMVRAKFVPRAAWTASAAAARSVFTRPSPRRCACRPCCRSR